LENALLAAKFLTGMRLVFLCSSLEIGRDGVGDYTRRLAAECIRQGQEVQILALNDKAKILKPETGNLKLETNTERNSQVSGLKSQVLSFIELQESEGTSVECLRLPGTIPWSERVVVARDWLNEFNPDWVSLQFVPFGFHPKGLCFGLGKKLSAINSKKPWHIMFHELWLGLGEGSSLKHRIWGAIQRAIVLDLINRLRPQIVHTQAEPYREVLEHEGIKASILPLFGNIPYVEGDGWNDLLAPQMATANENRPERNQFYLSGVFGSVPPEWDAEQAVNILLLRLQRFQKRLVLVFLGKCNLTREAFDKLKLQLQNRADVLMAGERTSLEISKILQSLDLGLAASPWQLIQKSGSVAAMLEHDLPVLVTRDDWHLPGVNTDLNEISSRLLSLKQFALLETLPMRTPKSSAEHGVGYVATHMLAAMSNQTGLASI
jgi:hypothetical protein